MGRKCAIVERWNPHVGGHGIRQDLFGIIDIIALDPERGVVGVQCCTNSRGSHINKMLVDRHEDTYEWLNTPGTALELWTWRKVKVKRGGRAMRWEPRIEEIVLDHEGEPVVLREGA